jgi:hypothetical protein
MSQKFPFPSQPHYTAIALAYRNAALIADSVLPRQTVLAQEYKWEQYTKSDSFNIPDTKVGRTGQPNRLEFSGTEQSSFTVDHALEHAIPQADIEKGTLAGTDPRARRVSLLTDSVALAREKRVADLLFAAGTYPSGNKVQLSGNDQWNSGNDAGNPITDILAGLDACVMRPNTMVLGQFASTGLRRNKYIVSAYSGAALSDGLVPVQFLTDLFEVQVVVGQSWVNSAKKGQTASYARLWGKHCALLHINPNVGPGEGITFGWTAQYGQRIAGSNPDPNIGMRGGEVVRVGESVDEKVVASDVGYFIQDCVA